MEGVHWGTYLISMLLHSLFGLIHRAHDCDPAPPTISGLINRTFKLKVHFLNDVYSTFTDQYILYACALVCEPTPLSQPPSSGLDKELIINTELHLQLLSW